MIGIDDGIANGNLNWADIFFIVGAVLALIAAVLLHPRPNTSYPVHGHSVLALAVGCAAFGLFLL